MNKKRLFISILVSVALAMPVGGFMFGFFHSDFREIHNPLSAVLGRVFYGVLYAFLTPGTLGFPPEALTDHAQSYNTWSYIIISGLIIFGICTAFSYYKGSPKS